MQKTFVRSVKSLCPIELLQACSNSRPGLQYPSCSPIREYIMICPSPLAVARCGDGCCWFSAHSSLPTPPFLPLAWRISLAISPICRTPLCHCQRVNANHTIIVLGNVIVRCPAFYGSSGVSDMGFTPGDDIYMHSAKKRSLQYLVVNFEFLFRGMHFRISCKSAFCGLLLKNLVKKFEECLVSNIKVSTFASAIERDTPWGCDEERVLWKYFPYRQVVQEANSWCRHELG